MTPDEANADPLPFARLLGIRFVRTDPDCIEAEMVVRTDLGTSPTTAHGGALMALADTVGAVATVINLPKDANGTTTIESKTNFLAAAPVGTTVTASASPIHRGRRTQVWQTRITAGAKLVALTTQTQMVL